MSALARAWEDLRSPPPITGRRGFIFLVAMAYLAALVAIAILYFADVLHPRDRIGTVPTPVPWFGALGAVIISLTGVFIHYANWLPSYRFWHLSRPLVGATVGVIAVLIFQAGILAVDENIEGKTDLFYYVIAFFVGYNEAAFRDLLEGIGRVLIRPGTAANAGSVGAMTIAGIDPPLAPAGTESQIIIRGGGLTNATSVAFDDQEVTTFGAVSDRFLVVTTPRLGPGRVTVSVFGPGNAVATHDYDFV
jgi:hypothetical protein